MNIATLTLTRIAAAALAANRFITPTNGVPAAGANTLGVTRTSAGASGDLIPVDVQGTTLVEAGAAITEGAAIEADASGRAVTKASGVTVARALQAASGAGQLIEVLLVAN